MFLKPNLALHAAGAILFVAVCISAQTQPPAPAPNSEEPAVGTISGSVVSETGQPLAGATVVIRELNGLSPSRSSTTTDSEGVFRIKGLAPAVYAISASLPAYVTPLFDPTEPTNQYRIGDSVRIELMRGGVITGTVSNAAGEPVIGVRVRAAMVRDVKGQTSQIRSFGFTERLTDDRGIYRIYGVAPGTYFVSAGGGGATQGFQLNAFDYDVPTYAPSSTRDNAAEVSVRAGEETDADIRYRGEPGRTISGTVKSSGQGGASVTLVSAGSRFMPMAGFFQFPGTRGFSFSGIGDGEYDLIAQEVTTPPSSLVPDLAISEPRRVIVKGADVTGIELLPRPLASLSGRIALEPAKTTECQGKRRPLFAETLITLKRPEKELEQDRVPYFRAIGGTGLVDTKGNFVLRNLMPGRYLFEPRFFARYWYLASISGANAKVDAAANWTPVKSGDQLGNFTITLAEGAASVRGKLTPPTGAELPSGMGVYLVPADREKAADVLRYFVATVEADGTFAFNNLPPARYFALAQTLDAQMNTLAKLRLPEAVEARTKLRRTAETQKTDLELKACQNLTDYQLAVKQ